MRLIDFCVFFFFPLRARYFDGTMKDYYTYLVAQASAGGPM